MSKEGKRPGPGERQVFHLSDYHITPPERRAANPEVSRAATERLAEVVRLNNEATRRDTLRRTVATEQDPGKILETWKELRAVHETDAIGRDELRRIDMHLATLDPSVIDTVAKRDAGAQDLVETLHRFTRGNGEAEATPHVIRQYGFLRMLRELGQEADKEFVETGANNRTRTEHLQARKGVEIALLATRMGDFVYALNEHIGKELGKKLSTMEKASLNDHMTRILDGGHWEHPTQETALAFAAWETILGDARNVNKLTITPEPANFQPEEQPNEHDAAAPSRTTRSKKRKLPSDWQNIVNAPRDAFREFRKLLSDD